MHAGSDCAVSTWKFYRSSNLLTYVQYRYGMYLLGRYLYHFMDGSTCYKWCSNMSHRHLAEYIVVNLEV